MSGVVISIGLSVTASGAEEGTDAVWTVPGFAPARFQGERQSGWVTLAPLMQKGFLLADGSLAAGWKKVGKNWYYFLPDGTMFKGLINWNGSKFYLDETGRVYTGWKEIDGKQCYFTKDALEPFHIKEDLCYELFPESLSAPGGPLSWNLQYYQLQPSYGAAASGWQTIDGVRYCFNEAGELDPDAELNRLLTAVDVASAEAAKTPEEVVAAGGTVSEATIEKLEEDIEAIKEYAADIGFILLDINSGASLMYNPKSYIYSASTLKAPYVCALASGNAPKLEEHKDLIEATISLSDNDAYLELYQIYGSSYMLSFIEKTGVTGDFYGEAMYTDVRAKDLMKLWVGNLEYFQSGDEKLEWLLPYFRHSRLSYIDATLEWKYPVYSKAGWDYVLGTQYNIYNDSGIVVKEDCPYLLTILSNASPVIDNMKMHALVRDLDEAHSELIGRKRFYD